MSKEQSYIRVGAAVRREIYESQHGICVMCAKDCQPHELTAHHIQAAADGGSARDAANLAGVCRPCHDVVEQKKAGMPFEKIVREAGGVWPMPQPRLIRRS